MFWPREDALEYASKDSSILRDDECCCSSEARGVEEQAEAINRLMLYPVSAHELVGDIMLENDDVAAVPCRVTGPWHNGSGLQGCTAVSARGL